MTVRYCKTIRVTPQMNNTKSQSPCGIGHNHSTCSARYPRSPSHPPIGALCPVPCPAPPTPPSRAAGPHSCPTRELGPQTRTTLPSIGGGSSCWSRGLSILPAKVSLSAVGAIGAGEGCVLAGLAGVALAGFTVTACTGSLTAIWSASSWVVEGRCTGQRSGSGVSGQLHRSPSGGERRRRCGWRRQA